MSDNEIFILMWFCIGIVAVIIDRVDLRRNVDRSESDEEVEEEE